MRRLHYCTGATAEWITHPLAEGGYTAWET
jgi:hypothetical protein